MDGTPSLSHLDQNILALPREQVLESVEGDVVGHANGRAGGITHVVRAVPPPVPADTRKSNQSVTDLHLGCQGLSWVLGNKEAAGDQKTPGSHRGSLKKRSICSLWKEHMGLRGPARGPQEKGRTRSSLVSRRKERYGVTWVSRASQEAEEKVGALQTICRGLTKVWPHPKHYRVPETGHRATVSQTDRQRSQQGHSETGK